MPWRRRRGLSRRRTWPVGRANLDALAASLRQENLGMYLAGDYVCSSYAAGTVLAARATASAVARDLRGAGAR